MVVDWESESWLGEVLKREKEDGLTKEKITSNGSVETVILATVELQSIIDKLPEERKDTKERSETDGISAKERLLEDFSKRSSTKKWAERQV